MLGRSLRFALLLHGRTADVRGRGRDLRHGRSAADIVLPLVVIAAATRTDAALRDGAGHAAALTAGYQLGFVLTAVLLLVGAAAAGALLPGRR